jgi:hypothetical protein
MQKYLLLDHLEKLLSEHELSLEEFNLSSPTQIVPQNIAQRKIHETRNIKNENI